MNDLIPTGQISGFASKTASIEQTEPLAGMFGNRVKVPVVALGGVKGLGERVLAMVKMVAQDVEGGAIADCGHFLPEERPEEIVRQVLAMSAKVPIKPQQLR